VVDNGLYSSPKTTFGGTAVDPSSILVTRALVGDVNLDNSVNIFDYNILLSHYTQTGQSWATGDVNGDGTVNIFDYNLLLSNYTQNLPGGFSLQPADTSLTNPAGGTSALGGTSTAVPGTCQLGSPGARCRRPVDPAAEETSISTILPRSFVSVMDMTEVTRRLNNHRRPGARFQFLRAAP